jgi:hypothetical protein
MARQSAQLASSSRMFSTRIPVEIKIDMTQSTPRVIWAHEKPLLEALHGEDKVVDIDVAKLDEGFVAKIAPNLLTWNKKQDDVLPPSQSLGIGFVFHGDPRAEYSRLADVYGKHPDVDMTIVENVYGRYQQGRFEQMLPKPDLDDLPEQQLRSLIREYGYPGDVDKDATPEQKEAHRKAVLELRVMAKPALVELAQTLDVQL